MPTQRLKTSVTFEETSITVSGENLTARQWSNGLIDVQVNEAFARANGYQDLTTMEEDRAHTQAIRNPWGGLPSWCRYTGGAFKFVMPE